MFFTIQENRVKCGKCNGEFDFNKNILGCPFCKLDKQNAKERIISEVKMAPLRKMDDQVSEYFQIPPSLKLSPGKVIVDDETRIWGAWLMFNDFFAPKFLSRVLAWKMYKENLDSILLSDLINESISLIKRYNLSHLKGFPNLEKDREGGRLVNHFLRTFVNMGLINAEPIEKGIEDIWKEKWNKIRVSLTKEGLKFAQIKNSLFDDEKTEQILTSEEKDWLIGYLKQIDKEGYKEYSVLREVFIFLKSGKNENQNLWIWFENNDKFRKYILSRSKRARDDEKKFKKQVYNYARSFASAKISLLRELGVVKDRRNDYSIVGDF